MSTATKKKEWKPVMLTGTTIEVCPICHDLVDHESEWQGEDETGRGWYVDYYRCPNGCGHQMNRHFE